MDYFIYELQLEFRTFYAPMFFIKLLLHKKKTDILMHDDIKRKYLVIILVW